MVLATSQNLRNWEIFQLEDLQLSEKKGMVVGKLKAANGKYVVKEISNTLVANSDKGQEFHFVNWTMEHPDSIAAWGYLEVSGSRVKVKGPPGKQQLTFVNPNTDPGTKFKVTFISKGKKALEEDTSYKVSLTYGIADASSPTTCPHLVDPSGPCFQYYLFANIGYPYGYFSYSPLVTMGGFGKTLGRPFGEDHFNDWKFDINPQGGEPPCNSTTSTTGDQQPPNGVWSNLKVLNNSGAVCAAGAISAYRVASFDIDKSQANCKYRFTLSTHSLVNGYYKWDGADHSNLKDFYAFAEVVTFAPSNPWYFSAHLKEMKSKPQNHVKDSGFSYVWTELSRNWQLSDLPIGTS